MDVFDIYFFIGSLLQEQTEINTSTALTNNSGLEHQHPLLISY